MKKGKTLGGGRSGGRQVLIAIMVLLMLMVGLAFAYTSGIGSVKINLPSNIPLKSAEDYELERRYGPLAPVIKAFGEVFEVLGGGGESGVGIEAEIGYTSTTGESIVFTQKFSGVQIGYIGMSGIYVKPSLGSYRALKLYDPDRGVEGEVWIKPAVRIRAFEGEVEDWLVKVSLRLKADEDIIDEKTLEKSGHGTPPKKIKFDKYAVRGKAFYALLLGEKQIAQKLIRRELEVIPGGINVSGKPKFNASKICFYADYQGIVKFKEETEPVVKELKDVKLGCFNFDFKETGDFEMIVEKNITVAPLAEVLGTFESGMEGMTPTVETVTVTVSVPYTTYLATHMTTIGGHVYTVTQVITKYKYYTITQVKTKWKTTTVTKIKRVPKPYPVTVTKTEKVPEPYPVTVTKTITVTKHGGGGGYGGSVLGNVTVITPEGRKPIQDVRPGDLVLTERGFREVREVKAIQVFNLYKIELEDGKALIADDAQPVITGEGVKRVGELKVGDELQALNGTVRITNIKRHELKAIVYDLIFDEPLNYYANGVLVNDLKSGVILLTWPYSEFVFIRGW